MAIEARRTTSGGQTFVLRSRDARFGSGKEFFVTKEGSQEPVDEFVNTKQKGIRQLEGTIRAIENVEQKQARQKRQQNTLPGVIDVSDRDDDDDDDRDGVGLPGVFSTKKKQRDDNEDSLNDFLL